MTELEALWKTSGGVFFVLSIIILSYGFFLNTNAVGTRAIGETVQLRIDHHHWNSDTSNFYTVYEIMSGSEEGREITAEIRASEAFNIPPNSVISGYRMPITDKIVTHDQNQAIIKAADRYILSAIMIFLLVYSPGTGTVSQL